MAKDSAASALMAILGDLSWASLTNNLRESLVWGRRSSHAYGRRDFDWL